MDTDREYASSIGTAGVTANTTEGNSRASRESGLLCSHPHGESIDTCFARDCTFRGLHRRDPKVVCLRLGHALHLDRKIDRHIDRQIHRCVETCFAVHPVSAWR